MIIETEKGSGLSGLFGERDARGEEVSVVIVADEAVFRGKCLDDASGPFCPGACGILVEIHGCCYGSRTGGDGNLGIENLYTYLQRHARGCCTTLVVVSCIDTWIYIKRSNTGMLSDKKMVLSADSAGIAQGRYAGFRNILHF